MDGLSDLARIDLSLDTRAISFENPSGARGAGGQALGGRKGAPNRVLEPGQTVVLADIAGPGVIRHIWMTFPPAPPEIMRALRLELFYDAAAEPSVSVPALDFFGLPHGRPAPYTSLLASAQEGRGFNAYLPLPFHDRLRLEITNAAPRRQSFYYQIDYTLQPSLPDDTGYLHVAWRRENPTVMRRDFTIVEGLRGPGRFLGCNVGVRVLDDGIWYGEGELKVYRDGDGALPTICGTGLEDYVGSAWGMGAHSAFYAGAPLDRSRPDGGAQPEFVSFYRWHVADPIIFARDLRVTIQQIGAAAFPAGEAAAFEAYRTAHPAAGAGWRLEPSARLHALGIAERVDDYCATAYVYCRQPQPVPRLDMAAALADIERRDYEEPSAAERRMSGFGAA